MNERILLGKWTEEKLDDLLKESPSARNAGKRIDFLSRQFIGVAYKEATLAGGADTPEVFVINLERVDCFTFLDYIEAMRISGSFPEFRENLKKVRYRSGKITYETRNHFFTDWREHNPDLIEDVTGHAGGGKGRNVMKMLNLRDDGTFYLPGVPRSEREIVHVPVEDVDDTVIQKLRTGDYIGIYSEKQGLDVSHVGIIVKESYKDKVKFRHASSAKRKVIDEDFIKYIAGKPGIIVLRPKGPGQESRVMGHGNKLNPCPLPLAPCP
ncbi:MAG: DUF1460 domain-containing protein [Nitrospirae bacterium]|nr:DUF1460 domain-containing protein [Nitrospirota bacterium]